MSLLPAFLYSIPKRSTRCCKGGELFQPGMEYHSVLIENEHSLIERKDFCSNCLESYKDSPILSQWKSAVPAKGEPAKPLNTSREEKALELLLEGTDPDEAFVLALYLVRKKWLKVRGTLKTSEGAPLLAYEIVSTGEMLTVPALDLSSLEIEKLQQQIATKLAS